MGKTYGILEVVVTLDPNGRLLEYEVPEGVTLTVDRVNDAGEIETECFYGPVEVLA